MDMDIDIDMDIDMNAPSRYSIEASSMDPITSGIGYRLTLFSAPPLGCNRIRRLRSGFVELNVVHVLNSQPRT